MDVNTVEYVPLTGSSYVPLPSKILKKKAILNIHNKDQKCFIWSVLAALHPVSRKEHANQVSNYMPFETQLKCDNINMPMSLSDIRKFEHQNQISINVFVVDLMYSFIT